MSIALDNAASSTHTSGFVFMFNLPAGTHVWIWHRYLSAGDEEVI